MKKATTSEAIVKSGIPRTQFYQIIGKYPEAEILMLKGVLCDKILNAELVETLIKK